MLILQGIKYVAQCVECSRIKDEGGVWRNVPCPVSEEGNGKLGGIFCPNCLPEIKDHLARIKKCQEDGTYIRFCLPQSA